MPGRVFLDVPGLEAGIVIELPQPRSGEQATEEQTEEIILHFRERGFSEVGVVIHLPEAPSNQSQEQLAKEVGEPYGEYLHKIGKRATRRIVPLPSLDSSDQSFENVIRRIDACIHQLINTGTGSGREDPASVVESSDHLPEGNTTGSSSQSNQLIVEIPELETRVLIEGLNPSNAQEQAEQVLERIRALGHTQARIISHLSDGGSTEQAMDRIIDHLRQPNTLQIGPMNQSSHEVNAGSRPTHGGKLWMEREDQPEKATLSRLGENIHTAVFTRQPNSGGEHWGVKWAERLANNVGGSYNKTHFDHDGLKFDKPKRFGFFPEDEPPTVTRWNCDGCQGNIKNVRFTCQDCDNFDYCPECYGDAAQTHSDHRFESFRPYQRPSPGLWNLADDMDPEALKSLELPLLPGKETIAGPKFVCASCQGLVRQLHHWQVDGIDGSFQDMKFGWKVRISDLTHAMWLGCGLCSSILIPFFGTPSGAGTLYTYEPERPWYLKSDPIDAARRNRLDHISDLVAMLATDAFHIVVRPEVRDANEEAPRLDGLHFDLVGTSASNDPDMLSRADILNQFYLGFGVTLKAFASNSNPAASLVPMRLPNVSPGSDTSFDRVRTWYKTCREDHGGECVGSSNPGLPVKMPMRVVDVSAMDIIRVITPASNEARPYCTLSYTWGGPQRFCLSRKSMSTLESGFSIEDVPATIADAIKVTRELGVPYLWVDSLCIIQDDEIDKARQISQMDTIYRNSALTIISTKTHSVNESFLDSKADSETGVWPSLIPLTYPCGSRKDEIDDDDDATARPLEWATVWLMPNEEHTLITSFREPITRRSWCLQERLLSPRVLSFGRWPTWRCGLAKESDGGFYQTGTGGSGGDGEDTGDDLNRLLMSLSRNDGGAGPGTSVTRDLRRRWHGLVDEFSRRALTDPSDRLPALGGVAELLRPLFGGERYLAGLWEGNLLSDLMWGVKRRREWLSRPPGWEMGMGRGPPTWSWACFVGQVSYAMHDNEVGETRVKAEVLGCKVEAGDEEEDVGVYGKIRSGELKVEGLVVEVEREELLRLFADQDVLPRLPTTVEMLQMVDAELGTLSATSRVEMEKSLPEGVVALIVFGHNQRMRVTNKMQGSVEEGRFYSGLLLAPVGNGFERIGSFHHEMRPWLKSDETGWTRRIITIR